MHPLRVLLALLLAVSFLSAQSPVFTEVAGPAGLNWTQDDNGSLMGAGGAFLDYDGDGYEDIFLTGGLGPSALFRNLGNGTFLDVTAAAGIFPHTNYALGVAVADIDNDGDADIYELTWFENRLWRNEGNGTFVECAMAYGIADERMSCAAAFADYDQDGWLDLFVGDYVAAAGFTTHVPWGNRLYHGNGDGTFTEVTAQCGVAGAGTTLAATWADLDGDGDPDLLVGNDYGEFIEPNQVFRNGGASGSGLGAWSFTDIAPAYGAASQLYCMGLAIGDFDRDRDLDFYASNLGQNVLLRNDGPNGFLDVTVATGTQAAVDPNNPSLLVSSWSVGFADFDLDGWLDLYVSNGHIPTGTSVANSVHSPNMLFRNTGTSAGFVDISNSAGIADLSQGRGTAFADYDRDGDIDILQVNCSSSAPVAPLLYRNDTVQGNHWVTFDLEGQLSNRDGILARVNAELPGFGLVREVNPAVGFESSSSPRVHMGLGSETEVPLVTVRWPSGIRQRFHHLPVDREFHVLEPTVTIDPLSSSSGTGFAGETLELRLVLRNHLGMPTTVSHQLELRIAGGETVRGPLRQVTVPPGSAAVAEWSVVVPVGVLTALVDVEALWTVADQNGGVDQWSSDLRVFP